MAKLAELQQRRADLDKQLRQFAEQHGDGKDWTDEIEQKFDQLSKDYDETKAEIEVIQRGDRVADRVKRLEEDSKATNAPKAGVLPGRDSSDVSDDSPVNRLTVPARARATRTLQCYENEKDAYVAGHVLMSGIFRRERSRQWLLDHGFEQTLTGANTDAGFLITEEMDRTLVRLREERGVFPRYARPWPMASDSLFVPRDLVDTTAYWVGPGEEIDDSEGSLAGAKLTAEKLAGLTKYPTEIDEDSVVDIGDMLTRRIGYAMADAIDKAGFLGDGTSTYGGHVGLSNALHANAIQDAAASNDSALELDLADFEATAGLLAQYDGIQPVWFIHSAVYYASMARLMNAAGGTTGTEIANGTERRFLGYPVQFTQVLPSTTGTLASTILCYLGDLSLAATVGTRRGFRTAISSEAYFKEDMIAIKATQRVAVTVHERGETINERPIVALKTSS